MKYLFIKILTFCAFISICRGQHVQNAYTYTYRYNYRDTSYCQTPVGEAGSCVSLKVCPEVLTLFKKLEANAAKEYSKNLQHLCGNQITPDQYPVVCCTAPKHDVQFGPVTERHTTIPPMPTTSRSITTFSFTPPSADNTKQQPLFPFPGCCNAPTHDVQYVPVTERHTTTPRPIPTTTTSRSSITIHSFNLDTADKTTHTKDILCTIDSTSGLCKPLQECSVLWNQLTADSNNEEIKANIRRAHNACGSDGTIVCCPLIQTKIPSNNVQVHQLPNEETGCGLVNQTTLKIIGGEESSIGAWPWMALIGYDPYSARPFKCGGTLISSRHVITAAHCIRQDLSFVRLGEFDLSVESETRHVDINVIKHERHPQYGKNRRSDLAILLLETIVQFNELIAPICMPNAARLRSKSYVDSMPYVAGWGNTEEGGSRSHVLKQTQLPVLENDVCRRIYTKLIPSISGDEYDDSVICAGYTLGGSDTCQGDSGGPLMIPELYKGIARYYLIGVVSYGRGCGQVPGIYISTRHWMDWIIEKIELM